MIVLLVGQDFSRSIGFLFKWGKTNQNVLIHKLIHIFADLTCFKVPFLESGTFVSKYHRLNALLRLLFYPKYARTSRKHNLCLQQFKKKVLYKIYHNIIENSHIRGQTMQIQMRWFTDFLRQVFTQWKWPLQ